MLANLTIPVLNRYDLLDRMIESIDYPIGQLLIIDNGNELDYLDFPHCVRSASILPMYSNLGVSTSWNLGIKVFNACPVFFFASADVWFQPGDLEKLASSSPDEITLHKTHPHWQTFAIGSGAVEKIGLFDEALHPIYFEDNDYERRAEAAGVQITYKDLDAGHDNSSTINSDAHYKSRNLETFADNQKYYAAKVAAEDFSDGKWNITRTRKNNWEK